MPLPALLSAIGTEGELYFVSKNTKCANPYPYDYADEFKPDVLPIKL